MGHIDKRGDKLRKKLNKAIEKDRRAEVLTLLGELERHEPDEPRWPQRLGDALKRAGRLQDAEDAYVRAMHLFAAEGFLPQAVALGKLVVALNPARSALLDEIDQQATRNLRANQSYGVAASQIAMPGAVPAAAAEPPAAAPAPAAAPSAEDRSSVLGSVAQAAVAEFARPLEPASDTASDEVRFEDVQPEDSIVIDVSDIDAIVPGEMELASEIDFAEPLDASRLAQLSAAALFSDVSQEALGELARAAELCDFQPGDYVCRKGEDADSLFVIVEGSAHVVLPWLDGGGVALTAGQVCGEACLLYEGKRQADVRALGGLVLLRIAEPELRRIVEAHPHVQEVLFNLLLKRLVTNTLQTSSLFAAFDPEQRKELALMFEVRLAPADCALQEQGKRSDGLYVLLAGEFAALDGDHQVPLPLATLIGHRSLLSQDVAPRTVVASVESLVLRLPAGRFSNFAMQYPPALAHLSELAAQPLLG
ncbi:MAG: cyclic nucleotide-binding domain-containing protein [Deltaproteobacteria bacterium]|nr:cyclic nucleotide-binding domain-containing protein [Deltaproteobacteria bacterium]MBW2533900.1 cyclic nucleotide-binding domain-containing protein [Deltaproteobacteria bacterium]